jgi:hypothetical protein
MLRENRRLRPALGDKYCADAGPCETWGPQDAGDTCSKVRQSAVLRECLGSAPGGSSLVGRWLDSHRQQTGM